MIHATVDGSYKKQKGSKRVLVGILDTGIDGNHPDIAANLRVVRSAMDSTTGASTDVVSSAWPPRS